MPKIPGRPERKLRSLDDDLAATIHIDGMLVYVPGNRKFRCIYCDLLFDTYGDKDGRYGCWVTREQEPYERLGAACPGCTVKIEEWWRGG